MTTALLRGRLGLILMSAFVAAASARGLAQHETSPPAPTSATMTLDDAIDAALAGNRTIRADALGIAQAKDATATARSARLPSFDVRALGGIALTPITFTIPRGTLGVYPGVGALPAADAPITTPRQFAGIIQASLIQPVSQLYKIGLSVQSAALGEQLAQQNLNAAREDTVRQVKQAYANLAVLENGVASAELTVKSLTDLAALSDRRLAEETVLKADDLSVHAKLGDAQYQWLKLRDTLDSAREAFNRLLGRDLDQPLTVAPLPPPSAEELNLATAETQALARRPELQKARLQAKSAALDVRRARADYLPDVSLQLSYLSFANVNFLPSGLAHFGVTVDWQPFDWSRRQRHVADLRLSEQQATLAVADAEAAVRADVRASYRRLQETRALLDAKSLAEQAERERLRELMDRFGQNAALPSDVLREQASMSQVDTDYQQALADFWSAKADFDRSVGEEH